MTLKKMPFEKTVGKGENTARPTIFSTFPKTDLTCKIIYFVVCKYFQFWPVQNFSHLVELRQLSVEHGSNGY